MSLKKWKTLYSKKKGQGHVFSWYQYQRKSLATHKQGEFDVLHCYDWCHIVALDENDSVIMVRQYRHGKDAMSLEIAGGAIESKEDPLAAAQRELREETGYTSKDWRSIATVAANPAFMNNDCFFFLALGCQKTHEQELDELEECEVVLVAKNKILEMVERREIDHCLVVTALLFVKEIFSRPS